MKKPQRASVRITEKGIKKYEEGLPVIKRRRIDDLSITTITGKNNATFLELFH